MEIEKIQFGKTGVGCTACGFVYNQLSYLPKPEGDRLAASCVCSHCGHIFVVNLITGTSRDLTREEKRNLPRHWASEAMRAKQEDVVKDMWG